MGFRVAGDAAGFPGALADFLICQKVGGTATRTERRPRSWTSPGSPRRWPTPRRPPTTSTRSPTPRATPRSGSRRPGWVINDFRTGAYDFDLHRRQRHPGRLRLCAPTAPPIRDVRGWVEAWLRTPGFDMSGDPRRRRRGGDPRGQAATASRSRRRQRRARRPRGGRWTSPTSRSGCRGRRPSSRTAVGRPSPGGGRPQSWELLAADLASLVDDDTRPSSGRPRWTWCCAGELPATTSSGRRPGPPREPNATILDSALGWAGDTLVVRYPARRAGDRRAGAARGRVRDGAGQRPGRRRRGHPDPAADYDHPDTVCWSSALFDRVTDTGVEVDQHLALAGDQRRAFLGALEPGEIIDERTADGTIQGVLGAATARLDAHARRQGDRVVPPDRRARARQL